MKKIFLCILILAGLTGCSWKSNETLSCTKDFEDGTKHTFNYSFKDGKVYKMQWVVKTPILGDFDAEGYKAIFNRINEVNGCEGEFTLNDDKSYTTVETCDYSVMTDEELDTVFMSDRASLTQTRNQILKGFSSDSDIVCE